MRANYVISIDWLQFYGILSQPFSMHAYTATIDGGRRWEYKRSPIGTRQYKNLWHVFIGKDSICDIQETPHEGNVLESMSCIFKIDNRLLYRSDLWEIIDDFCRDHGVTIRSLTRIDICADFNELIEYEHPEDLIHDFAKSKIRHIGQGKGATYFETYNRAEDDTQRLRYTGISFGGHSSDCRVYMYNKTKELLIKDKPYIRDTWKMAGLNTSRDVWRLEISIKSKATHFVDGLTGELVEVLQQQREQKSIEKVYHTFRKKLFSFIQNREHITNISREPRLQLLGEAETFDRHCLRPCNNATRTSKIVLKQLYNIGQMYAPPTAVGPDKLDKFISQIAAGYDLSEWLGRKRRIWEEENKKLTT